MKRIITITVQDRSGVLNRVTGLLQRRQFNISNISVGPTETKGVSRMTLVVEVENERRLEQVTKQLNKQVDVLKVSDITDKVIVVRELSLIKVSGSSQLRNEINGIIDPFRASIIDVHKDSLIVQITGRPDKIDALIDLLRPYGIKEITRTGLTALLRGHQALTSNALSMFTLSK
ncbi:acetolactate synthase small subunit [Cytobacillus firmus]|nr:acetolactate synthase small subunit [Cytobacillus firmus]